MTVTRVRRPRRVVVTEFDVGRERRLVATLVALAGLSARDVQACVELGRVSADGALHEDEVHALERMLSAAGARTTVAPRADESVGHSIRWSFTVGMFAKLATIGVAVAASVRFAVPSIAALGALTALGVLTRAPEIVPGGVELDPSAVDARLALLDDALVARVAQTRASLADHRAARAFRDALMGFVELRTTLRAGAWITQPEVVAIDMALRDLLIGLCGSAAGGDTLDVASRIADGLAEMQRRLGTTRSAEAPPTGAAPLDVLADVRRRIEELVVSTRPSR